MFEVKLAQYLARSCEASYLDDPESMASKLGLDSRPKMLTMMDQLVAVVPEDHRTVLVFRGTVTLGGWIDDVEFILRSHPVYAGLIHWGFSAVLDDLYRWVLAHLDRTVPVQVTGHSLGGALALLAASRLRDDGYDVMPLYTFGQPKVGDRIFAKAFTLPHYRVVNDLDPVPHTPFAGYVHTGEEVRLPEGDSPSPWRRIVSLVTHLRRGVGSLVIQSMRDHFIGEYVKALTLLQQK